MILIYLKYLGQSLLIGRSGSHKNIKGVKYMSEYFQLHSDFAKYIFVILKIHTNEIDFLD